MGINILKDNFSINGNDYDAFSEMAKKMTDSTKSLVTNTGLLDYLSTCLIDQVQKAGKKAFFIIKEDSIYSFIKDGRLPSVGTISTEAFGPGLLEENNNSSQLIIVEGQNKYLVSAYALPTFLKQISLGGSDAVNRSNIIRNLHIADACYSKRVPVNLIYREVEHEGVTVRKVFAVMGKYFSIIPQTIILDALNAIKADEITPEFVVRNWDINQEVTTINVEFPSLTRVISGEKLIPGISLKTSDIGRASFEIQGTLRNSVSYVVFNSIVKKHTSNAGDVSNIINDIYSIIDNYETEFKKYETLAEYNIDANIDKIVGVFDYLSKYIKESLPNKRLARVRDCILSEFESNNAITLANIATMFVRIPQIEEENGLNAVPLEELRCNCGRIVDVLLEDAIRNEIFKIIS